MSIIVEDGTGKSDSESFISVADASIYFTARGNTTWDALDDTDEKEPALRKATDYMVATYRDRWEGVRYTEDQALCWPRAGVVRDSWSVGYDEVPAEVQNACAEFALKSISGDLNSDLKQGKLSVTVGPIRTEYDKNSPQRKRYHYIDAMLAPFLDGSHGSHSVKLVRC